MMPRRPFIGTVTVLLLFGLLLTLLTECIHAKLGNFKPGFISHAGGPPARGSVHMTGTFPRLATVPKKLSRVFRHSSYGYSEEQKNWEVAPAVNWTMLSIANQRMCASSWLQVPVLAFTVLLTKLQDSFPEGVTNTIRLIRNLKSTFAHGKFCAGGWPYRLLDFITSYSARTPKIGNFALLGYEQPSTSFDWLGLMLTVQQHPAIVFLHASTPSFKDYTGGIYNDPGCAQGIVDHSMIVAGYDISGPQPYWILANSWGRRWGMQGYMYMQMTGGQGVCNMHAVPPVYPIIKLSLSPCFPINPCGIGTCSTDNSTRPYKAVCDCPQGFVAAKDSLTSQTCVPDNACTRFAFNPCGQGDCTNDGEGGYACSCPNGMKNGEKPDGSEVCVIDTDVQEASCSLYYTWNAEKSCSIVAMLFGLNDTEFQNLNPTLDCGLDSEIERTGKQVCVRPGVLKEAPLCTQYYLPKRSETCAIIMAKHILTPLAFFALNPGLFCANLFPPAVTKDGNEVPQIGSKVCVKGPNQWNDFSRARDLATSPRCPLAKHIVRRGEFCSQIVAKLTDGNMAKFQKMNNGFVCSNDRLYIGQVVCTGKAD